MKFFDHFADTKPTKLGAFLEETVKDRQYEFLEKYTVKKESSILEIGPGKGYLASLFIKNGYENYDVIEPNDLMREMLKKVGARNCYDGLIPPLKLPQKYDLIIITDVFEHLNDTRDAMAFINDAYKQLNKDGKIFIVSPELNDWGLDFWNCDYTHSNPTSLRRSIEILENHEFNIVSTDMYYSAFKNTKGFLVSRLIKLLTIFASKRSLKSRFYKIRLAFSGRFWILASK